LSSNVGYLSVDLVLRDDNCLSNLKTRTTMIRSIKVAAVMFAVVAMAACGGAKKTETTTTTNDSTSTMMAGDSAATSTMETATTAVESMTK
jgi:hypothetical protein